jgi:hypothetical protein
MNPTKQEWYRCPHCHRMHRSSDEAEGCCSEPIVTGDVWVCAFCDEYHYYQEEAEDCCQDKQGE